MKNNFGIYSDYCWLEGKLQSATIYYDDGIITAIEKGQVRQNNNIKNVGNKVLMPGVIDAHVHINEPGRTDWEGFDTGTQAAAAGGITTIVDMPLNASPVTISANAFKEKLQSTHGKLHVNCGFYGGLIPGSYSELEGLLQEGVLGIKVFLTHSGINEFPNVTKADLENAMPLLAKQHTPLLAHCELTEESTKEQLSKDPTSYANYVSSRPKAWENSAVKMMIELCERYNCPTHIVHVSSAEALQNIEQAKSKRFPLTAETCAHYIYFNAEAIPNGKTIYKCAPPIREKENNELLKDALANGTLDFVASDHSPAPPAVKEIESGNLQKAWGGIAGLQFLLPASWSALKDKLSIEQFIPLVTEHPAKMLSINNKKGVFKVGADADFVVWLPEEKFEVKEHEILHRHKVSPYIGEQLFGVVDETYVNGSLVYSNKNIITKNAGRWLLRK